MTLKEQHKLTFGTERPVIGCLHMLPLPGTPYWDPTITLKEQVKRLTHDAKILKELGFDAFVFANEGDRPYLTQVGPEVIANYVRIATEVLPLLDKPYGCGVLIDPKATLAVAKAIGASFIRTYVSNSYVGVFGRQDFNPGEIFRYQRQIGAEDVKVYTYFEPHAGTCLDTRTTIEQIGSGFAAMPISGMLVGGPRAGVAPNEAEFIRIHEKFPEFPLILGSGSNKDNIGHLLSNCDGVIVGTTIKRDGFLYNELDPKRAEEYIKAARKI